MRGNITKRGKNSWQLKFDVPSVNGKHQQRYATVRGTYKDAQKELTRLLGAADEGALPDPSTSTLAEYLRAWLDTLHGLSPKTLERYRELGDRQIIPHLGATKLQKLAPEQVQQWHSTLIADGLSARTVGHAHKVLRSVLQCAVKNRRLARNVPIKSQTSSPSSPVMRSTQSLLWRSQPECAAQWGDIDLDAAALRVERSLEEPSAGLRLKSPKTKSGRRNITLPAEAIARLRAYKIEQMQFRLAVGANKIEADTLVFTDLHGKPLKPHTVSRAWRRVVAAKKLPEDSMPYATHTPQCLSARAWTFSRSAGALVITNPA